MTGATHSERSLGPPSFTNKIIMLEALSRAGPDRSPAGSARLGQTRQRGARGRGRAGPGWTGLAGSKSSDSHSDSRAREPQYSSVVTETRRVQKPNGARSASSSSLLRHRAHTHKRAGARTHTRTDAKARGALIDKARNAATQRAYQRDTPATLYSRDYRAAAQGQRTSHL